MRGHLARRRITLIAVVAAAASILVAPTAPAADTTLAVGARGAVVSELQTRLAAAGHDPGPIDGVFGARTEAAVRALQQAHSLPVSGAVDAATWSALEVATTTPILTRGDRGDQVLDLQRRLSAAGYDPGPRDGMFGLRTVAAVGRFQTAISLPATGSVDQATWDQLAAVTVLFGQGSRGDGVVEVQTHLGTLGFSPGLIDGKFGLRTGAAVRAFQASLTLPVTGSVDPATLDALRTAAAGATQVVLGRGDLGDEVVALQTRLARVGFSPGPIDGKFGLRTESAIARFQRTFGLVSTGAADQVTLTRLVAFEREAERGYAAGYVAGGGAGQWRTLVGEVFARWGLDRTVCADDANLSTCVPGQVDNAIAVIACESNGVPFVVNTTSGVTGLFQHRMAYWSERVRRVQAHFPEFPSDASPYDPEHNTMVAALLVYESRGALVRNLASGGTISGGPHPWSHWSCRRVTS